MDLNCDLGESSPHWQYSLERDIRLLDYISSMNLACGFHAGDPHTMHIMVQNAQDRGVAVGAHPSYPDKENFGRISIPMTEREIYDMVLYQLGSLQSFLKVHDAAMHHVKPHGALYNDAARDPLIAESIVSAIVDFDPHLIIYGLSGSTLIDIALKKGLHTASEVFADRAYLSDASLAPRNREGAVIESVERAVLQSSQMITSGKVESLEGGIVTVKAETLCIHGDGKQALPLAMALQEMIRSLGMELKPFQFDAV
jgi:UPF0271 protein